MRFALPLLAIAVTLASATPAPPPTPDVRLCCPSIDNRSPRGTLIDGVLTSTELCCGYSDGTTCCYAVSCPASFLVGAELMLLLFLFAPPC
ncbi:hypothetical protein B0H10DRAFT_2233810 [Mycena sp. CBHHK59/15]|nr:hypothetical protein B0H10DRAFT_2233810 [Mycena sp. CBHHK59/15]